MEMVPTRSRIDVTLIPNALKRRILQNIECYSIVLLADERLCGTGTLVVADGVHGILTAGHVSEALQSNQGGERPTMLRTVLDPRGSKPSGEPMAHFRFYATTPASGEWGPLGPDLAFIRIPSPSPFLSGLKQRKSFWDLTRRGIAERPVVLTEQTPSASYGVVAERTQVTERTVALQAYLFYGTSPRTFELGGYDYIDMSSRRSLQPEIPESFGGLSGGGLWHFDVARYPNDQFEAARFHLSGVAFFQLPELEPDIVTIRYHGPRSIYELFLPRVRRWLADAHL